MAVTHQQPRLNSRLRSSMPGAKDNGGIPDNRVREKKQANAKKTKYYKLPGKANI
jgi:hypothetical protein